MDVEPPDFHRQQIPQIRRQAMNATSIDSTHHNLSTLLNEYLKVNHNKGSEKYKQRKLQLRKCNKKTGPNGATKKVTRTLLPIQLRTSAWSTTTGS
eukprot:1890778-Amphidinium_carterae.4